MMSKSFCFTAGVAFLFLCVWTKDASAADEVIWTKDPAFCSGNQQLPTGKGLLVSEQERILCSLPSKLQSGKYRLLVATSRATIDEELSVALLARDRNTDVVRVLKQFFATDENVSATFQMLPNLKLYFWLELEAYVERGESPFSIYSVTLVRSDEE